MVRYTALVAALSMLVAFAPPLHVRAQPVPGATSGPATSPVPTILPTPPAPAFPGTSPPATPPAAEPTPLPPSPGPFETPSPAPTPQVPAGVVPSDVTVELAGTVSAQFVAARVRAEVLRAVSAQPGVTANVVATVTQPLRPGDVLEAQAQVTLRGNGTYADVQSTTSAHVRVESLPVLDPALLFYSDDPERLGPSDDGVLFRGTIAPDRSVRAYVYHVSDTPGRRLYLALQAPSPARVQVLSALAGPSDAFSYVGHLATVRYLLERAPQESYVATLAPGTPYLVPLPASVFLPGQLVAAIADVRVLEGEPVTLSVVAASNGIDPATLLAQPEHADDGHERRGAFALSSVPPLALAYTAGGSDTPPFAVGVRTYGNGQPAFPNLRPGGAPLAGDYGVLRRVSLQLANAAATPQDVYLYEQVAGGGGATTTLWFDGDPAPTEVRCVSDPATRYLVRQFTLGAGESRTVTGSYMTDGTSYFPLLFGLTATPPAPVPAYGCGGGRSQPNAPADATPAPAIATPPASPRAR